MADAPAGVAIEAVATSAAPRGVVTSTDEKNSRSPILTRPCGWCAGNVMGTDRSSVHDDARVNVVMRSAIMASRSARSGAAASS